MNDNPWRYRFAQPPFVLPADREKVLAFNKVVKPGSARFLQVERLLPEPFIGDPNAPVLLLSNNPGIGKQADLRAAPDFMERMRGNLSLRSSEYPFIYLDPKFKDAGKWWRIKLKSLISRFTIEVVARSVCNVVYFPYPSVRFGRVPSDLPSQQFGFDLVSAAIRRRAIIVVMRKGKIRWWCDKVSGLEKYDRLILLKNPQTPAVSPGNCNKGDYERIIAAIEAANEKPGMS